MTGPRATFVVTGQVVVAARPDRVVTAEAIGLAEDRVVSVGERREVLEAAAPGARVVDAGASAVIPGIHDFHLHLTGMARRRREVDLTDAVDVAGIAARIHAAVGRQPGAGWLIGGRWEEGALGGDLSPLEAAAGDRPVLLTAHDGHSAWASAAARRAAGIDERAEAIPGGRLERDPSGALSGVVRERAMLPLLHAADRLEGEALAEAIAETVDELLAWGVTGATDAGDYDADRGIGPFAALGESFSRAWEARDRIDGRLRLTMDIPAAALAAATELGLVTGAALEARTLRMGWAKLYADGTLGSGTAALFAPRSCDGAADDDLGILRLDPAELDAILATGRAAGIGIAAHAIGDRAAATVLEAIARAAPRASGVPPDRLEHAQLVRPLERPRFGELDVTASVQPIHLVSDRETAERCWQGRLAHAYAYRSLADAGARLALGTDAPIESANPWLNLLAAVRRDGWRTDECLSLPAALRAATLGPAMGMGRADEGHLAIGARADLAVLSCDLPALLAAGEGLAGVRAVLTVVDGREVHRS
ncbi:MAG: amidohydrolase family protein [Chloroflexota bacterium]